MFVVVTAYLRYPLTNSAMQVQTEDGIKSALDSNVASWFILVTVEWSYRCRVFTHNWEACCTDRLNFIKFNLLFSTHFSISDTLEIILMIF